MNIEARMTDFSADLGASARLLAAAAEPVFLFDGKQPVLVWANAAALAFVGHASGPGAQLPHFDRSMPAMVRLRALAEQDLPAGGVRTDLVFWTPRGVQSLACVCRRATFAFAPEALIVHGAATGSGDTKLAEGHDAPSALPRTVDGSKPLTHNAPPAQPRGGARRGKALKVKSSAKSTANKRAQGKIKSKSRKDLRARRGRGAEALSPPEHDQVHGRGQAIVPQAAVDPSHDIALREIARQIQAATRTDPPAGAALAATPRGRSPMLFAGEVDGPAAPPPAGEASVGPKPAEPATAAAALSSQTALSRHPTLSRHNVDFLSHIGHEIRTPLNSILGFAEIMREERFGAIGNARYKTYAADIHDSAVHALSLINDLLDLSRIEAGGLQLDLAEVDVARVTAQAVASLLPTAAKAEVILSAPTGRPLPKLVCDARSLKQMLLNLLSNAIKHTDAGGAVWITAAISDDGGLVIRVQDTGIGMRAEDIAFALEPYGQVGPAESRAGGTGLGLPLTKAMADANGGRLLLERIAGGGLAALLVFPAGSVVRG